MKIKLSRVILFATIYVVFGVSEASAEKLPEQEYIKGFIEGAKLTDDVIVRQFETLSEKELSGFEKRALRTRMGRKEVALPSTYYAGFCIPTSVSAEQVAAEIHRVLKESKKDASVNDKNSRGKHVYEAVRTLYPCAAK